MPESLRQGLDQRALAALLAISRRCSGERTSALANPPLDFPALSLAMLAPLNPQYACILPYASMLLKMLAQYDLSKRSDRGKLGTFTTFTRASAHLDDLTVGQCCKRPASAVSFLGHRAHGRVTGYSENCLQVTFDEVPGPGMGLPPEPLRRKNADNRGDKRK